jgi:hypothetical protein
MRMGWCGCFGGVGSHMYDLVAYTVVVDDVTDGIQSTRFG